MAIYYQTDYVIVRKRTGKKEFHTYRTKSLTEMHKRIRDAYPGSTTIKCDTSVKWMFGTYAEVVAQSPKPPKQKSK